MSQNPRSTWPCWLCCSMCTQESDSSISTFSFWHPLTWIETKSIFACPQDVFFLFCISNPKSNTNKILSFTEFDMQGTFRNLLAYKSTAWILSHGSGGWSVEAAFGSSLRGYSKVFDDRNGGIQTWYWQVIRCFCRCCLPVGSNKKTVIYCSIMAEWITIPYPPWFFRLMFSINGMTFSGAIVEIGGCFFVYKNSILDLAG